MVSIKQANQMIRKEKVNWIQVQFSDIFGKNRCVFLRARKFIDGDIWNNGVNFDGSSIGFLSTEESDINAHPDPNTLRILPFETDPSKRTAIVICNIRNANNKDDLIHL